jgi:hypothetical protein
VLDGAALDKVAIEGFLAGNTYVNVYTSNHPSGEIRGQIIPEGATPVVPPDPTDLAGPIVPGQSSITFHFISKYVA